MIDALKDFILWCKDNQLQRAKISIPDPSLGDPYTAEFEFPPFALLPPSPAPAPVQDQQPIQLAREQTAQLEAQPVRTAADLAKDPLAADDPDLYGSVE